MNPTVDDEKSFLLGGEVRPHPSQHRIWPRAGAPPPRPPARACSSLPAARGPARGAAPPPRHVQPRVRGWGRSGPGPSVTRPPGRVHHRGRGHGPRGLAETTPPRAGDASRSLNLKPNLRVLSLTVRGCASHFLSPSPLAASPPQEKKRISLSQDGL